MTRLNQRIVSAFLWMAAFCCACGVFLSITLLFRSLPPVPPVAVGLVTIQKYAKLRDYLGAALFMTLVPLLTIGFRRIGERLLAREQRRAGRDAGIVALLFTAPFLLSPLFYLTTGKAGWILVLPVAIAYAAVRGLGVWRRSAWLRRLFRRELHPYHALACAEASGWVLFRYVVTGRRIAHIPTLFLEVVFVALFFALFWGVSLLLARLAELNFGADAEDVFRRITSGSVPLVFLPLVGIVFVPTPFAAGAVAIALLLSALLAMRAPMQPRTAWRASAILLFPFLLYCVSYASTAHLPYFIDLFHLGETLGPASDYLRGKAPYTGVFPLHGLLQDGALDAVLMSWFGRSMEVAIARSVVIGGFLSVSLWYLGIAIFESIPLAALVVVMGAWTTTENNRTLFQIAAVTLLWIALRRRSALAAVASGVFAAVAVFFSYEIGIYTIVGAIVAVAALSFSDRKAWRAGAFFLGGLIAGTLPFVLFLASRGALGSFFVTSFVTIPRVIDAVWSLPFPDLVSTFRNDLNLRALADFVLQEKFHLIVSPLTIAVALVYYLQRWLRGQTGTLDDALLVVAIFAGITQRTAFGRAEFRHQYFAAFLIGPLLVLLGIAAARAVREAWREGGEGTRAFLATVAATAFVIFAVLFWVPDLINWRINDTLDYQRRVVGAQRDLHKEEVMQRVEEVTHEIRLLTRAGDPIYDFSNQPAFYFFANRVNPSRFYQVPIASPPAFQAEVIRDLERAKPKVILRTSPEGFDEFDGVPNAVRAQAIAAYLDDCYRFHKTIRGVELWRRRADARPAAVGSYLRRFRIPTAKELVQSARERMVFPIVGSAPGASGAYWVSDLTLHNPLRESIAVSLRYVGGEFRADRRIELAPRQTIRWPDVIRTLFGAPEGVGALWLTAREGRVPVAVVKTADVAHGGRASVEEPLGRRNSATAGADAELTVVGIPAARAGGRRVNVGAVNVGTIPATFRLVARNRRGDVVGRPLETGVPEDEVWMVTDVERELGITLDENMTLRITPIAGSGVAFATIVDADGQTDYVPAIPAQRQ